MSFSNIPTIQNDEGESWNMAKAYLQRVDQILTACDLAQMRDDINGWKGALIALYKEIYPKLKPDEQHQAEILESIMRRAVSNPTIIKQKDTQKNKKIYNTEPLLIFELFLRTMLEKKNLLTPKTGDATKAYRNG